MGTTTTPKYAVDIYENRLVEVDGKKGWKTIKTPGYGWNIKSYGRPTPENVEKFALAYGKSLEAGGVNEHLSKALGYIPYPTKVVVRYNHAHGADVASWTAAPFQVW